MNDNNEIFDFDADLDFDADEEAGTFDDNDDTDLWLLNEDEGFEDDSDNYGIDYDTDEDGTDSVQIYDMNMVEYDNDDDGIIDKVVLELDTDNDGEIDIVATRYDYDGDSIIDETAYSIDSNSDGEFDVFSGERDVDGDGKADAELIIADINHDGEIDFEEKTFIYNDDSGESFFVRATDIDYDGSFDEFDFGVIEPNEEVDDEIIVVDDDDVEDIEDDDMTIIDDDEDDAPAIELPQIDYDSNNKNGMEFGELDLFDADDADPDKVLGEPEKAIDLWEFQGDTGRCAIYAQKFVIEEYTGREIDIEDLVEVAEENKWFTEEGGTPFMYMHKLLDHYGVPNEVNVGNDIEDIAKSLENGNRVIVAVDSDEYWYGENDSSDTYTPGDGMNHAVEVIGINTTDPDNPTVIVNDSGVPEGGGLEIPMDTFIDAWEDSSGYMIECM